MSAAIEFFCVGPQRTATTWLQQVLQHHSRVSFPRGVKETMFFDTRYEKGLPWYLWHFRDAPTDSICGEIAPSYFDQPVCWERIQRHFPAAKIIINVRNPVDRSYSLFQHHLSKGRVPNNFAAAIERMPQIISSSHYAQFCPQWEQRFAQVHYLVQEDIQDAPQQAMLEICQFLEIGPMTVPPAARQRINQAAVPSSAALAKLLSTGATRLRSLRLHALAEWGKRIGLTRFYRGGGPVDPLARKARRELQETFQQDVRWLEQRLDRDFSAWFGDRGEE